MKKLFKLLSFIFLFALIVGLGNIKLSASDLDYIDFYQITVDPVQDDGTLNIKIDIKWEVLDSSSDGPLSWVKIGIPNKYVDNIKALSSNIDKIKYYSDSGSFIRIDFDKNYYRGEVVYFSFSFHQSRMYHVNGDEIFYDYNPGYFDEINVGKCVLKWNKSGVSHNYSSTTDLYGHNIYREEGDYYVWERGLHHSEAIKVQIGYERSYFNNIDEKMQYSSKYITLKDFLRIVFFVLLFIGFFAFVFYMNYKSQDPYLRERGFVRSHTYIYFPYHIYYGRTNDSKGAKIINPVSTGSHSGGHAGGGCACACACACAGGGRAGCSKKDFYHTDLKTKNIIEELKTNKKHLHRKSK